MKRRSFYEKPSEKTVRQKGKGGASRTQAGSETRETVERARQLLAEIDDETAKRGSPGRLG